MSQTISPAPPPLPCPRTNGLAVTSLVLGITAIVTGTSCCCGLGIVPAALGIVFGHVALGQIRRAPAAQPGREMALAGLITSYAAVALQVLMTAVFLLIILVSAAAQPHHVHPWRP